MTTFKIPVARPRLYWRAHAHDVISRWLPDGPDNGYELTAHWKRTMDELRWDLIADGVTQVSNMIAAGSWSPYDFWSDFHKSRELPEDDLSQPLPVNGSADVTGMVTIELQGPTRAEIKQIGSWFSDFATVSLNPCSTHIQNGRHRLWTVGNYLENNKVANTIVPIAMGDMWGGKLATLTPDEVGQIVPSEETMFYNEALDQLAELEWFDQNDPVNMRYLSVIREAANGHYPSPV